MLSAAWLCDVWGAQHEQKSHIKGNCCVPTRLQQDCGCVDAKPKNRHKTASRLSLDEMSVASLKCKVFISLALVSIVNVRYKSSGLFWYKDAF